MNWRAHWVTALFWAALAARGVLEYAHFDTPAFDDRIVSNATMHAVDVGARAKVYFAALAAFVLSGLLVARLAPRIGKRLPELARTNVERASAIGLLLVFLAGLTSLEGDALWVCASLEIAYVACALLLGRLQGSAGERLLGAAFLVVASAAYALLAVTPLRTSAPAVAALTLVMVCVLAAAEQAGRSRFVDFGLAACAAAAFVPLALVVREEIVLCANQRGLRGLSHAVASFVCATFVLILALALARKRPFDAQRALARISLPALILGFAFLAWWTPTRDPQFEMLEAGNAGLSIQQWFDHGRLPFFETFNVHGLSDCLMGFLYSAVNGWSGIAWQHWDFVPTALTSLAIYAFLSRVVGSPTLAFVLVVASPFTRSIFPPEVAMAVPVALLAAWSAFEVRVSRFALAAALWVVLCAWRMDIGGAAAVALFATWIVRQCVERERGFAWKQALFGFLLVQALVAIAVVWIASARDVDLGARFAEFRRIASSDTAFGRAQFFGASTPAVYFRLFIAPALTLVATTWLVLRARQSTTADSRRRFATYALVFLAAFSMVIFTRGLVRHSFVEHDATYVTAFQFVVIVFAPVVWATAERRTLAILAAVLSHALLPLAFDVSREGSEAASWRANNLARASIRLRSWSKTAVGEARFDRTPITETFARNNVAPLRELTAAVLSQDETFVDLSASPMLYVFSGSRSPHWVNHLIVLQGDFLQKRLLAELGREKAPLIVMQQEADLALAAGMVPDLTIDQVPLALWHARVFDELMSRAEPFKMAGRWQVWARSDWAPARDPGPAGEDLGLIRPGSAGATFDLAAGETLSLAVNGNSAAKAQLAVQFRVEDPAIVETRSRYVDWSATTQQLFVDIATVTRPTRITVLHVGGAGERTGLTLSRVALRRIVDPARAEAVARAESPVETVLGQTALLFGRHDRAPRVTAIQLSSEHEPARAIEAGAFERFTFASPPREGRSLLCELTLANPAARAGTVVVRYGVGELVSGSFRFDLALDLSPAEYVFRPGMQANWHRRPNAWIEIGSPETALTVRAARLCAND